MEHCPSTSAPLVFLLSKLIMLNHRFLVFHLIHSYFPFLVACSCSLLCFKKHKETPCAKLESTQEKSIVPALPVEKPLAADEPTEVLQKVQLESIASSSEIRDALKDESLQKLILEIDGSPDAENALDKAMELEVFRIFTDKILSAVGQ
ncbi:hypothetical protein Ddye_016330 [Dipteronia dyeriana]|uniref:Uncharacterized protein n=1 Tax=Dipteronia dyeriana TaxID=168575 RepID=A0AAD9WZG4_9ROSI|nr:hypothetical protein Ddye_016330 [Dipteronia dyeriana]